MISDIFSVADEVFGLVMLYNEYDVWEGLPLLPPKKTAIRRNSWIQRVEERMVGQRRGRTCSMSCVKRSRSYETNPKQEWSRRYRLKELEIQIKKRLLGKTGSEESDEGTTPGSNSNIQQTEAIKPCCSGFSRNQMM